MIRKALTLSIIVIFSLLVVQSVWLYKSILSERESYRFLCEQSLIHSVTNELNSRIERSKLNKNFNVEFVSNSNKNTNKESYNDVVSVDTKDIGSQISLKITMEQFFQDLLKNTIPLNLDSLSFYFNKELSIAKGSLPSYYLRYIDDKDTMSFEYSTSGLFNKFGYSSFDLNLPLNANKKIILEAKIFYPLFVYKGDFLLIVVASFILFAFIVVAIVLQFKMLSRQITLAQLKENLTSFFTHELRSPLQSALSSIEMAEMYSEKSEVNNFLELSRNKVIYINRLIEKLLDINKLEKNKVNLIKESFPLMESISQYLNHYFSRSDKNIEIEPLFDPALLIYGDKIHISNAMGNLIENAVKYSSDSVHIKIYAEENPHYITIIVEDNGIGIAPADQKRIFERFYRVKSAEHATKGKGFGLGLNYVKWVALSHKGDVKVESTPGQGSKFFFTVKKG